MDSFHDAGALLERYVRDGFFNIYVDSFREASAFLECFLSNIGLTLFDNGKHTDPTGELLFSAVQWYRRIETLVHSKEPAILEELGDRRERYTSDGIDCRGTTSHSCGLCVMLNLLEDLTPEFSLDVSMNWRILTVDQKQWFAEAELTLNSMQGPDLLSLADGIRFERVKIEHHFIKRHDETLRSPVDQPEVGPFLGLVFNHDSTVSRLGEYYKHIPPIPLAPQALRILKFIHEAGRRGRTLQELVPDIVATRNILKTEKSRLNLSEIDIDLGATGQYVVRCTRPSE